MRSLDNIKNNKEHNKKRSLIPDHPYRMLTTGGFRSGKTNALLNLIKNRVILTNSICMEKI